MMYIWKWSRCISDNKECHRTGMLFPPAWPNKKIMREGEECPSVQHHSYMAWLSRDGKTTLCCHARCRRFLNSLGRVCGTQAASEMHTGWFVSSNWRERVPDLIPNHPSDGKGSWAWQILRHFKIALLLLLYFSKCKKSICERTQANLVKRISSGVV